jgi:RNA polymerase sigma factor (sigma-70 family)
VKNLTKDRTHWLEVWPRFLAGDQSAFSEIYEEFIDSLFAYGCKITRDHELVKDCIQDIFIELHRLQPILLHPEYIEFYLFKSLKNAILHKMQKDSMIINLPIKDLVDFELKFDIEKDVYELESDRLLAEKLKMILQSLDPQKRELLYLRFSTGMNYGDIGQLLGINPDTVKKQLYRLLDLIREKHGVQLLELFVICLNK